MASSVLLVDDEPLVLEGLKRALHKENYEVLSADSAAEALEILSRRKVDVIVSDEMMPGMTGSEFLGIASDKYPETIRIILTGHPTLDSALRSINKGHVYRFLVKPFNAIELSFAIRQAIQQRELLRRSLSLLETVRRQNAVLEKLEHRHPGITRVDMGKDGIINIPEIEEDLDTLLEKIDREVERCSYFFHDCTDEI